MAVYNVEHYLDKAIESVINQTLDFKENIQLIMIDDGSQDESYNIALKYKESYPENIILISHENQGVARTRNLGLTYVEGEFVNFLDSDDLISEDACEEVLKFMNSNSSEIDFVTIPIERFGAINGSHHLNYKFDGEDKVVDLLTTPKNFQLHVASSFFKYESLKNFKFKEDIVRSEDAYAVNLLLLKNPKYGLVNKPKYYYRKLIKNTSVTKSVKRKKEYFTDYITNYCLELINHSLEEYKKVPKFIQYLLLYEIREIIYHEKISEILNENELKEFWKYFNQFLSYIDSEVILNHDSLENYSKSFLIYLKNNKNFYIEVKPNKHKMFIKSKEFIINKLHNHKIHLDIVEISDNHLNFTGSFVSSCDTNKLCIKAKVESEESTKIYKAMKKDYTNTVRHNITMLDIDWLFYYDFDIKIPLKNLDKSKIEFEIDYSENNKKIVLKPEIKFRKYCNINDLSNFIVYESNILLFNRNKFIFVPYSFKSMIKLEIKSSLNILKSAEKYKFYSIFIKLIYYLLHIFMRNKRIWLFIVQPNPSDDNVYHLFKYSISQNDSIKKYLIVDKFSEDYKKLKAINKHIIPHGSIKHKILYLYSEKLISSHINHQWLNPFFHKNRKLIAGLTTVKKYLLQHGETKEDISSCLRKYYHNFHLILTTSEIEKNSLINGKYNYDNNVIQCLGFPRYDNLKGNDEKIILIAPSWRNYLNEHTFIYSDYYYRLKKLLNDKYFLNEVSKRGYKLIFKPPNDLIPFIDMLNLSNDIEINIEDSYQKLINNSSLMITDYLPEFFDFAYLKKPIIYYHEKDDYHYEEGYFKYESIGFGNVIKSKDELINKTIYYMDHDNKLEDKYERRIDEFFKYHDKKNSKRVYEWLLKNDN